jgi:hypothetical protein
VPRLPPEIERCGSLAALGALGRRLYARRLPRAQAGVMWTRYRLRKGGARGGGGVAAGRRPRGAAG